VGRVEVTNATKTRVLSRSFLENLVSFVLKEEGKDFKGTLSVAFVDEESMREVKRRFFGEDTPGDVVSFFYGEDSDGVWGEVIICVPVAERQSREIGTSFKEELALLLVHGLLHLLGYEDSTKEGEVRMTERTSALLVRYKEEERRRMLLGRAERAKTFAYAPYSHLQVGAALLAKDGRIFTGCNVENASFGVTLCAERVALGKAISEGAREFLAIAVISDDESFCFPCGMCRQALAEFNLEIEVLAGRRDGSYVRALLRELLPSSFTLRRGE